jgi:hypothetical protein
VLPSDNTKQGDAGVSISSDVTEPDRQTAFHGRVIVPVGRQGTGTLPCALLMFGLVVLACGSPTAAPADPLQQLDLRASEGAAAGYLPDTACGRCHADKQQSFAAVGMARSFARADTAPRVENFEQAAYVHQPSGRHYRMLRRDDGLWFQRHRLDADGTVVDAIELRVDWILGSGNRARSYLHQTEAGELYQLPIGWYSEDRTWAMSPGFEGASHSGVERLVRRECMFCHNAYPEVPEGSDRHDQPHLFPATLPQGIGCQRCHGPGAEHVRTVLEANPVEAIRAAIVNPARLDWAQRNDVCFQCHLLPAVEVIGARRMGRHDYSFRPGQALVDYLAHVDIEQHGMDRSERFQINHHAYRLQQSTCFIESEGQMGCVSCHDPHRKQTGGGHQTHYRERCLACHQPHSETDRQALAQSAKTGVDIESCTACHMPQRRTQDVVLTTMTDHRIVRGPVDFAALIAPLSPRQANLAGVGLYRPEDAPRGAEGLAYQSLAALRVTSNVGALDQLERAVAAMPSPHPGWHYELARQQLSARRYAAGLATLDQLDQATEPYPYAIGLRALAELGQGKLDPAAARLERHIGSLAFQPEDYYNFGLAMRAGGQHQRALDAFRELSRLRPLMAAAWYQRGLSARDAGVSDEARTALLQALKVNPDLQRARESLAALADSLPPEAMDRPTKDE